MPSREAAVRLPDNDCVQDDLRDHLEREFSARGHRWHAVLSDRCRTLIEDHLCNSE